MLKLIQFCFAIAAHNVYIKSVLTPLQSQWSEEWNILTANSVKEIYE